MRAPVAFLALAFGLFFLPSHSAAQRAGLGMKGGFTYGRLVSGTRPSTDVPGAVIGFHAPMRIANRFELQPELQAAALGSGLGMADGGNRTLRMLYLHMPVMGKYFMGNTFNLQAGPQLGLLLSAQQAVEDGTLDVSEQFDKLDIGANLGVGLDFPSGVDIGLRFCYGISSAMDTQASGYPRHRNAQLTAGYRFKQFKVTKFTRKRR